MLNKIKNYIGSILALFSFGLIGAVLVIQFMFNDIEKSDFLLSMVSGMLIGIVGYILIDKDIPSEK